MSPYPLLFSEWTIRNTTVANRVVFAPTCPTWVADPLEGVFTDQAVAYYEERAKAGCGLIIIGGTIIHREALYSEFNFPGLWNDEQVEGFARVAEAVHRHGCKLATQLLHVGPARDARAEEGPGLRPRRRVVPRRAEPGAARASTRTRRCRRSSRSTRSRSCSTRTPRRAGARSRPGSTASSSTCRTATCRGSSCRRSTTTARMAGAARTRTACASRSRRCTGSARRSATSRSSATGSTRPRSGPATSSWTTSSASSPTSRRRPTSTTSTSRPGVHHSYIHTPMTYEPGWERGYTKAVKEVSTKPVLLVGRITNPEIAEEILAAGEADAILLARQLFADAEWAKKATEGRAEDIRRCVAANYCWRSVIRGGRVQCVYNPEVGRERQWGAGTLVQVGRAEEGARHRRGPRRPRVRPRRGGPRARRASCSSARPRSAATSAGSRSCPAGPSTARSPRWLRRQAEGNGAEPPARRGGRRRTSLDALLEAERPDHVVVATGSTLSPRRLAGPDGAPLPGWETGNCVTWDEVATGAVSPAGVVVVLDDLQDAVAPLTAVKLAQAGCAVKLVTRWPMVGMETIPEVYYLWIRQQLDRDGRRARDRPVREGDPRRAWSSCSTSTRRSGRWSSTPTGS